jgi:transposase
MNPEQLKQVINYDYQLMTFAIGLHQYFLPTSEKGAKLSAELIDFAQKFGNFVHQARQEGFIVTPTEVVN